MPPMKKTAKVFVAPTFFYGIAEYVEKKHVARQMKNIHVKKQRSN